MSGTTMDQFNTVNRDNTGQGIPASVVDSEGKPVTAEASGKPAKAGHNKKPKKEDGTATAAMLNGADTPGFDNILEWFAALVLLMGGDYADYATTMRALGYDPDAEGENSPKALFEKEQGIKSGMSDEAYANRMRAHDPDWGPLPKFGSLSVGECQKPVHEHLKNAADSAGIHPDLLAGVWGIETAFSTHKTMISSTGCSGPFQFAGSTFEEVIKKYGAKIVEAAGDSIPKNLQENILNGDGFEPGPWGPDLRFHPVVSTYAAAFYLKEQADGIKLEATEPENFGKIFSAYNLGLGNYQKLERLAREAPSGSAAQALGSAAANNPKFFTQHAGPGAVWQRYQDVIEGRINQYHQKVEPQLSGRSEANQKFSTAAKGTNPEDNQGSTMTVSNTDATLSMIPPAT